MKDVVLIDPLCEESQTVLKWFVLICGIIILTVVIVKYIKTKNKKENE